MQNQNPKILHNEYLLILGNPITFAFIIQIRHTLVLWKTLSIVNVKQLGLYQSDNSRYTQRLK